MKRLAILALILTAWLCVPAHAQFNGCSSFCGTSSSAIADASGFNNAQGSGSGSTLACTYTPVTTGTQNVAYTGATPSASGGVPAYTFSETGSLPTGLSINTSTGVISGTPSVNGSFPGIQVKVTDTASTVANCGASFTLVIAFAPQGVLFDASTWSKRTGALTGIAASQVGTISFWYLGVSGSDTSIRSVLSSGFGSGGAVTFVKAADGTMQIQLQNSSASNLLVVKSTALFNAASGWHHFLASWNLATPTFTIYIDDISSAAAPTAGPTIGTIDYVGGTGIQWFNFVDGGSGVGSGNLADVWLDPTTFLDLTVTANRRKFIDGTGHAVFLGSTGQLPTGSTPILFQSGNSGFANFLTNLGTGGNLTLQAGALLASPSNPP